MDGHSQPWAEADATNVNSTPVAYVAPGTVSGAAPAGAAAFPAGTVFAAGSSGGPVVYAATPLQQVRHPLQQEDQHQQKLQDFWTETLAEIEHMSEIKPHSLPLARIKKIMKASGEDIRMIASEAPGLLAKASEIFIQELTLRSWLETRDNNRRTLQKNDIGAAVSRNETFDFLVDVMQDNGVGFPSATVQTAVLGMSTFGMYYGNQQQPVPFAWLQPEHQPPPYNGEQQQQPPPPSSDGQDE
ncbi:nuclear transcription factor Y subunit C-2 [Brachypodium distachyon]|uniref:Transcription factor CBF/NF-Y/archaeal histone domain-containing protein n=1 Tax=Brachypodium distachyon TaxID=15368 RepID=I1I1W5_BRADI|nr:nuclear transcription factor Y subunit C-2 [Brachypodium distachyon]KQJ95565.1 hypothetical protein BRADI_3g17810v3 [Brachypodium distachyon]|eukprot:XP_003571526.1 nuclear transcription factor Y subunit C-2 [Brachypodium distachyon]